MGSYQEMMRKLNKRALIVVSSLYKSLKEELRDCEDDAKRQDLEKKIAWWRKEIKQAKAKLNEPIQDPWAASKAKDALERQRWAEYYRKKTEEGREEQRPARGEAPPARKAKKGDGRRALASLLGGEE